MAAPLHSYQATRRGDHKPCGNLPLYLACANPYRFDGRPKGNYRHSLVKSNEGIKTVLATDQTASRVSSASKANARSG
jgi:hypothetical protein